MLKEHTFDAQRGPPFFQGVPFILALDEHVSFCFLVTFLVTVFCSSGCSGWSPGAHRGRRPGVGGEFAPGNPGGAEDQEGPLRDHGRVVSGQQQEDTQRKGVVFFLGEGKILGEVKSYMYCKWIRQVDCMIFF